MGYQIGIREKLKWLRGGHFFACDLYWFSVGSRCLNHFYLVLIILRRDGEITPRYWRQIMTCRKFSLISYKLTMPHRWIKSNHTMFWNETKSDNWCKSSDYCIQFQHFQIMFEFELNENTKISLKTNLHMII